MPSGAAHKRLWVVNIPVAMLGSALLVQIHPVIAVGVLAGYLLGDIQEPDLDMIQKTRSESEALKRFGFLGCFFFGYWATYG